MKILHPAWLLLATTLLTISSSSALPASGSMVNVLSLGVPNDGSQSATAKLQAAMDGGQRQLVFPPGDYLIGTLRLPKGTVWQSSPETRFHIELPVVTGRTILVIQGGDVLIDGGSFIFSRMGASEIGAEELDSVISAKGQANIEVRNLSAIRTEETYLAKNPDRVFDVMNFEDCEDIFVTRCTSAQFQALLSGKYCRRVTVRDCKSTDSFYMTTLYHGSEWVKHLGNWSSRVKFQFQWWGGDSDDGHPWVADDTQRTVKRGLREGQEGFEKDSVGFYDVIASHNYAEYGVAAIWGSKGRNIIISDNISRFMQDIGFDTEGGEKVVISNNISINSAASAYACYFYGDELLITGNIGAVEAEGDVKYQGAFLRLHSPGGPEHFGNGRVLIEGNLFTSKVSDKPRPIIIEASRDVMISNNKLVNGYITMNNHAQSVTVTGNDFRFDLKGNYPAIIAAAGTESLVVRNNQFSRPKTEDSPSPADAALVSLWGAGGRRIVEGNVIDGWRRSLDLVTGAEGATSQMMLLRNSLSGEIATDGADVSRVLALDNISLSTLKKITLSGSLDPDAQ